MLLEEEEEEDVKMRNKGMNTTRMEKGKEFPHLSENVGIKKVYES